MDPNLISQPSELELWGGWRHTVQLYSLYMRRKIGTHMEFVNRSEVLN